MTAETTETKPTMDQAWRGFACPDEGLEVDFLRFVVVEYGRLVCRAFLDRFEPVLEERSEGLVGVLADWLERAVDVDQVWGLGLGAMRAAMRPDREHECLRAAMEFALDLQSCGKAGSWSGRLEHSTRLRWGGWMLGVAREWRVSSDGELATVETADAGEIQLVTLTRGERGWAADGAQALPQARAGARTITVLPWAALACAKWDDIRPRMDQSADPLEIASALQESVGLLALEAPRYADWVTGMVRHVIPLARPADEQYLSGSYVDRPGMVTCSFPAPAKMIGELLVHESSHHYFYVLSKLGDVEDGTDPNLYYSPARRQGRPLLYILLAYHAFGNIALYHQRCQEYGSRQVDLSRRREAELRDWLRQLEAPLRASPAITPLGRALWEPLAERLQLQAAR